MIALQPTWNLANNYVTKTSQSCNKKIQIISYLLMSHSQNLPFSKHTQVQEFDKQGLCLPTKKNKSFVKRFKKRDIGPSYMWYIPWKLFSLILTHQCKNKHSKSMS